MKTTDTIKALRDALTDITEPIAAMKRDLPEGYSLDGAAAVQMANDPEHYKRIARKALALTADASEDAPRQITYCEEEWITKTDWVQTDFQKDLFPLAYLGQHRADIMRDEIARLRRVIDHSVPVAEQSTSQSDGAPNNVRQVSVVATPAPERVPARTDDELRHMLWSSTIAGCSVTLNHIEAGQFLALLKAAPAAPTDYAAIERETLGDPDKRTGIYATAAPIAEGSVLAAGQILAADRRSNMSDDEALRFGRAIESMTLRAAGRAAPIAEASRPKLDTIEFTSLLNEWRCGYQYGPATRTAEALAALIEHITEWADRRHPAAEHAKPEPVKATPAKLAEISNDSSFVAHVNLAEGAVIDFTEVFKTTTDSFNRGWNAGYQAGQQAGAVDGEASCR